MWVTGLQAESNTNAREKTHQARDAFPTSHTYMHAFLGFSSHTCAGCSHDKYTDAHKHLYVFSMSFLLEIHNRHIYKI